MRWTVVLPVKALPAAKSRLLPAIADPATHRDLVLAMRSDTLAAAQAAPGVVARVLVVADQPSAALAGAEVLVQQAPGLNAALAEAAEHAAASWPSDGVAALVGDLPALRPDELAAALIAAAGHPRAFVPDAAGTGTTLLAARPGTPLGPAFGSGSAARHRSVAVEVAAGAGLRHDVDTGAELLAAAEPGAGVTLGPRTAAVLARSRVSVRSP